ncbi:enhancer of polycomb-like-domain-containing protein [Dipodascopsis tothii]|uniref:enhancer of polycomb-like-domain-containing protein n=1 Tax=Dipodascopsis tothii TaxID=44089 RepID=UPI0034CD3A83
MTKAGSARFRQRKISVKQSLQVIRQSDIPDLEDEQQRDIQQIETGVEKGEEEEHHLQAAINASIAAASGAQVQQIYIPTPDASKVFGDYSKYYTRKFSEPTTYIRFSSTVEDTSQCPYCLDEEDFEFLEELNSTRRPGSQKCSEDAFEIVMNQLEVVIAERQPFLSTDPTNILSFEELESSFQDNGLANYTTLGRLIYPHWKKRRIAQLGKTIMPSLRFEENEKDDSDPYVCFRRREFRQARKTRRTDAQSNEKLRRLRMEMEIARNLVEMVLKREMTRKENLQLEWNLFKQRAMVKDMKRKLGIKGDDDDLVTKKKKPMPLATSVGGHLGPGIGSPNVASAMSMDSGTGTPSAVRVNVPKVAEVELISLGEVYKKREAAIEAAIEEKLARRREADVGWEDYTDSRMIDEQSLGMKGAIAGNGTDGYGVKMFYLPSPSPSVSSVSSLSELNTVGSPPAAGSPHMVSSTLALSSSLLMSSSVWPSALFSTTPSTLLLNAAVKEFQPRALGNHTQPAGRASTSFRRRIGRGGRLWIDRR